MCTSFRVHYANLFIFKYTIKMETELTCNYSTTDFSGYLHLTDTSTESTSVKQSSKWTSAEIARFLQIIVRPILIILGTTGNSLTVYVMRRSSLKDSSSCFYMPFLLQTHVSFCNFWDKTSEKASHSGSHVILVVRVAG